MIVELDASWSTSGETRAKGYAYLGSRGLRADEIAVLLDADKTEDAWRARICDLNGNFAVVTRRGDQLWAAVDHIRTIPIFYAVHDGRLILSDRAEQVRTAVGDAAQCPEASTEFLLTGYVTGPDTLFPRVKQIQAGESLSFCALDRQMVLRRYFAWRHRDPWDANLDVMLNRLHEVHEDIAKRLVASMAGRQVVLPLSGGYDSRLIAMMLKQQGCQNVVCYTYGLEGNWESRISASLAAHLGYRWEFVPYTGERWRQWGAMPEFRQYCHFASNLTSIPHVQDWPAIFELKNRGVIGENAVVVPGHTGDFVTGGHIPYWFTQGKSMSRERLLKAIFDVHYSLWDWPQPRAQLAPPMTRRIDAVGGAIRGGSPADAADQIEYWDMNERQAKFICNSLRVYDFFGLDWRIPLFDKALLAFWSRIPVELRVGRKLYFEYAKRFQQLPVSKANEDRAAWATAGISLIKRFGLRDWAKSVQFGLKRRQWESIYENCTEPPLAWFTMIDKELFRRTYTGRQTLHSYLARLGSEGAFAQKAGAT